MLQVIEDDQRLLRERFRKEDQQLLPWIGGSGETVIEAICNRRGDFLKGVYRRKRT